MTDLRFSVGDKVRVDIPDESDHDHDQYHGRFGEVIEDFKDDADLETGDSRDDTIYRVRFDDGEVADFRWRDLRPA